MDIKVQKDRDFYAIPDGDYEAIIIGCRMVEANPDKGFERYLQITWAISEEGKYKDRIIVQDFYIYSSDNGQNKKAQNKLASLNEVLFGLNKTTSPEEYIGLKAVIKVVVFTPKDSDYNRSYVAHARKKEALAAPKNDFINDTIKGWTND